MINEDVSLLEGMIAGDKAAFTRIYDRYWRSLFEHALKITRAPGDAEDIVQEVFCSLWKRRGTLIISGSLEAYLFSSVRYSAIRYIENNLTRHRYFQRLSEAMDDHKAMALTETPVEYKELKERVYTVVEHLPTRMKEVYVLSRMQHLSHKEIATRLNIAESTVKKQIGYALRIIRDGIFLFVICLFSR